MHHTLIYVAIILRLNIPLYLYFAKQPIYEEPNVARFSILSTALSGMNAPYATRYESAVNWCEVSNPPPPKELARSMEEEEIIYSTPCEDEGNYGPIYCEPPCDEQNIYAEFEGKKFRKLYHKEIWLVS